MKRLVLLAALCATVFSCSKEANTLPEKPNPPKLTKGHLISLDSVRRIASELPTLLGDKVQTRSVGTGQIAEITSLSQILQKESTKISNNDASQIENIYIVDYADHSGFAVISADTRLDKVLAYSDRGNFEEALKIPGIKGLIANIPDYAKNQLVSPIYDTIDPNPYPNDYYIDQRYSISSRTESKEPFITTRWGQLWPFNKYTNGPTYGPTIAEVQLMAYYEWPYSIENVDSKEITVFNWAVDKSYVFGPILDDYPESVERIARATQKVFSTLASYAGMESLTVKQVSQDLPNHKYAFDGYGSLAFDKMKEELDRSRPIIMSGYGSHNWVWGDREASAWLVDGYQQIFTSYQNVRVWYNSQNEVIREENLHVTTEVRNLLHVNWGWDGRGDGYFNAGLYAPQQGYSYDFPTLPNPDDHNYRFTVDRLSNIRPQHFPK